MSHRVCLIGASGRVGREIVALLPKYPDLRMTAAIVSARSCEIGKACVDGVSYSPEMERGIRAADLVIDFSHPDSSMTAATLSAQLRTPILIGTTGHTAEQRATLRKLGEEIPLLLAPNTSLGVMVLTELALQAQRLCGDKFDVEIFELHHRMKKDEPSGTALHLAREVASQGNLQINSERRGARVSGELGVSALRGGTVPGEHTVFLLGDGERIEITHRAQDRSIFARGALEIGRRLVGRGAGFYSPRDLLASTI